MEPLKKLERFYTASSGKYTLDVIRELMHKLGDPQEKFRIIHVAGTSGKTSTAYYAAACLTAAGHKTGLTVSPHVDYIGERTQINMQVMSDADFDTALDEFLPLVDATGLNPSWFETVVAFAYWYFAREQVEYAVVEVGLGGLLDGTNVVQRADKVCVITDIGLDHTAILGNTIAEIAAQKAGIIQAGNEVVMYRQDDSVMTAITERMHAVGGRDLRVLADDDYTGVTFLPDLPSFQRRNFWLASRAAELALGRPLTASALTQAQGTYIPGRMEIVDFKGKTVVLDGAHNAQKLGVFARSLQAKFGSQKIAALVAFSEGDEARLHEAVPVIADITDDVIVTTFVTAKDTVKKSVAPEEVVAEFAKIGISARAEPEIPAAFAALLEQDADVYVVVGSFYLLNHIRPLLEGRA